MSLQPCGECGQKISTAATRCPNCGAPVKKKSELGCMGTVGALGLVLFGIVFLVSMIDRSPRPAAPRPPTSSPSDPTAPRSKVDTERLRREMIQDTQLGLAALGYSPGPADGIMGPGTAAAIRKFQTERGLPVTGEVDSLLVRAIARAGGGRTAPATKADECAAKIEEAQAAGIIRSIWTEDRGDYKGVHVDVEPTVWRETPYTTKLGMASGVSCAIVDPAYPIPVFLRAGGKVVAKFWKDELTFL